VWPQPERPVPVIQLPGLPPRSIPKSIVKSGPKSWSETSKKCVSISHFHGWKLTFSYSWLAQFIPFKKIQEKAPQIYTPRTKKFVDAKKHKDLEDFDDTLEDGKYDLKPTPPPLYIKDPPEGGLVGWLAVAGA
jgi:hypothetical protein